MDKENFDSFFRDFHFVGCAVRSKKMVYLLGREEYETAEGNESPTEKSTNKRVVDVKLNAPEDQSYAETTLTRFGIIHIAVASYPKPQSISVDLQGQVFARGSGSADVEVAIEYDENVGPQRGGVLKIKAIDGVIYGVGWGRSVCVRHGPNDWRALWNKLPEPKVQSRPERRDYGFGDIDGFSSSDIYAAGGQGDVWHFDGIAWKQIRFPSDMLIYNVCCGGDGAVYIAGHGGTVFRGRGDQWSKICEGIASYWFNDMVWYQDKVWGTNDYGICAFNENGEQKLDLPDFVRSSTGYMAQGDGVLVIAGMYGASMYDGTKWSSLVDLVDLYKKYGRES